MTQTTQKLSPENAQVRVNALNALGWDADVSTDEKIWDQFETMVHELCHNVVVDPKELTNPKDAGDTSTLARSQQNPDLDEIITTAVAIVLFDELYHTPPVCSHMALTTVGANVRSPKYRGGADEMALDLTVTKRVQKLAKVVYDYIESVV